MSQSKKVNLFLVGAAKAGTTAFQKNLSQHPQVYFCPIKEPHYFSSDILVEHFRKDFSDRVSFNLAKYLSNRPLHPHHQAFVKEKLQYESLFNDVENEPIIADASASYLWSVDAAKNIYNYNPQARILIVLRNPMERAFSHYLMDYKMGFSKTSFLQSIEEDQKKPRFWGNANLYVDLGLYSQQVKRYLDLFAKDQVLIIMHEELQTSPESVATKVCQFLNIEESSDFDLSTRHNTAKLPRNGLMTKMVNSKLARSIKSNKLMMVVTPRISSLLFKKESLPSIQQHEKEMAFHYFEKDIEKLEHVLLVDLSHWKS
jgi:hypothetical protein